MGEGVLYSGGFVFCAAGGAGGSSGGFGADVGVCGTCCGGRSCNSLDKP